MKRVTIDLVVLAAVATLGLAVALLFGLTTRERTVDAYLLALGALGMIALLYATREAVPPAARSPFDAARRRRPGRLASLPTLERTRRETALGIARAFDYHVRLRPVLRDVAAGRLASHRGVDLDAQPEQARAELGDEAWELLRADRPPPEERFAPGVDRAALRRLVDRLERM